MDLPEIVTDEDISEEMDELVAHEQMLTWCDNADVREGLNYHKKRLDQLILKKLHQGSIKVIVHD